MITYVEGDLFTSPAQTLVNTVNTVGVMGKGIAKTFKMVYPEMFVEYQRLCEEQKLTVGRLHLYPTSHKWVLNFPTKRHWRNPSRPDDIRVGLEAFVKGYEKHGVTSVSFPQLGCGNGGLDWEDQVRPLMEHYLSPLMIDVYIHIYAEGSLLPEHLDQKQMTDWLRSEPYSLPFGEVWSDLARAIAEGKAIGWSIIDREEPILRFDCSGTHAELAHSDLFGVWQRFRRFGFVTLLDIPLDLQIPPSALLDLLRTLPYVASASVATLLDSADSDPIATSTLLGEASAQGLRLVQPLYAVPSTTPLFQVEEGPDGCQSNLTLTQSAFA